MERFREQELFEGVVNQLIDEEALGVCFEMHRAIKLGYYELLYPNDRCALLLPAGVAGAWFTPCARMCVSVSIFLSLSLFSPTQCL